MLLCNTDSMEPVFPLENFVLQLLQNDSTIMEAF